MAPACGVSEWLQVCNEFWAPRIPNVNSTSSTLKFCSATSLALSSWSFRGCTRSWFLMGYATYSFFRGGGLLAPYLTLGECSRRAHSSIKKSLLGNLITSLSKPAILPRSISLQMQSITACGERGPARAVSYHRMSLTVPDEKCRNLVNSYQIIYNIS
jgi:hypothetical protein